MSIISPLESIETKTIKHVSDYIQLVIFINVTTNLFNIEFDFVFEFIFLFSIIEINKYLPNEYLINVKIKNKEISVGLLKLIIILSYDMVIYTRDYFNKEISKKHVSQIIGSGFLIVNIVLYEKFIMKNAYIQTCYCKLNVYLKFFVVFLFCLFNWNIDLMVLNYNLIFAIIYNLFDNIFTEYFNFIKVDDYKINSSMSKPFEFHGIMDFQIINKIQQGIIIGTNDKISSPDLVGEPTSFNLTYLNIYAERLLYLNNVSQINITVNTTVNTMISGNRSVLRNNSEINEILRKYFSKEYNINLFSYISNFNDSEPLSPQRSSE